ncbi:MAG: hypothetical protein SynsKO_01400 [Synoicihabitans sp.]
MKLSFEPMNLARATDVAMWSYPPPYRRYGYEDEDPRETVRYLTDPAKRVFAVLEAGELIAFRSFGEDGQVRGGQYPDGFLDTGGGLRPDLTGRGRGGPVLQCGLRFAKNQFGMNRFRVTIADFNLRAQSVCRKVGFSVQSTFRRKPDGEPFSIYTIELNAT